MHWVHTPSLALTLSHSLSDFFLTPFHPLSLFIQIGHIVCYHFFHSYWIYQHTNVHSDESHLQKTTSNDVSLSLSFGLRLSLSLSFSLFRSPSLSFSSSFFAFLCLGYLHSGDVAEFDKDNHPLVAAPSGFMRVSTEFQGKMFLFLYWENLISSILSM